MCEVVYAREESRVLSRGHVTECAGNQETFCALSSSTSDSTTLVERNLNWTSDAYLDIINGLPVSLTSYTSECFLPTPLSGSSRQEKTSEPTACIDVQSLSRSLKSLAFCTV